MESSGKVMKVQGKLLELWKGKRRRGRKDLKRQ
jgi:hypothetical protein